MKIKEKSFWKMQKKDNIGEVYVYSEIADSLFWGDEKTPSDFKTELDELGDVDTIKVYVNSPGGDVFAGQAMKSILDRHPADVEVYVDGLMASIATVFLIGAKVRNIAENAMIMIHNAWSEMSGNSEEMRQRAEILDKIDDTLVSGYAALTGLTDEQVRNMMKSETWMSAKEAKELGFVDNIIEGKKVAACVKGDKLTINGLEVDMNTFTDSKPLLAAYRGDTQPVVEDEAKEEVEPEVETGLDEDEKRIKEKLLGG